MQRSWFPSASDVPPPASGERPRASGDRSLVEAVCAGDEREAEALHDRVRPRIDRTIRALLGPGDRDHDDLVQQSFVELVLSLPRFRGDCALETWAATIAARTVFKAIARRKVERRLFAPEALDPDTSSAASMSRAVVVRDLANRIRRHLEAMDPGKAEAYFLHDVCGFDAREVASAAGITETAAFARIARGRRELQERLAQDPELSTPLHDMPGER